VALYISLSIVFHLRRLYGFVCEVTECRLKLKTKRSYLILDGNDRYMS